jgi:nitroreductase
VVCSNTSRSDQRYGRLGREFYNVIDGSFASMLILTAVNERIGAAFVGPFDDDKVSEILKLPRYVRPVGIITLGYPKETELVERPERIAIGDLTHYEKS